MLFYFVTKQCTKIKYRWHSSRQRKRYWTSVPAGPINIIFWLIEKLNKKQLILCIFVRFVLFVTRKWRMLGRYATIAKILL